MNTLLITAYDESYDPIGELTSIRMMKYAHRHGFDFSVTRLSDSHVPPSWRKVDLTVEALGKYQRVIWLDADQAVTNMDFVPETKSGIHVSRDWGVDAVDPIHFSMGGFIAHSDSINLVFELLMRKYENLETPFWEQAVMRDIYNAVGGEGFHVRDRRYLCSVPSEVQPTAPEPWQPGDWCAHLTGVAVAERIRAFHELIKTL